MFYEGSEKRLEITSTLNLLEFDNHFWEEMVKKAGAYILSHIENSQLKAFLLSESSLFVWKNRLLLITCGETHLVQASLYFQKNVAREQITSLLFQRHQATQPERQKSDFHQDSLLLQRQLKGDSQHWHEDYCGDIFIFGNNTQSHCTKNILMLHDLSSDFFAVLQQGKVAAEVVAKHLKLSEQFQHFTLDQYSFDPKGYSLNAIYGEYYFTLHLTPERLSSYLSFESNMATIETIDFLHHLINLFRPKRNYLMSFTPLDKKILIETSVLNTNLHK